MLNLGCNDHLVKSWFLESVFSCFYESQKVENMVVDISTTSMNRLRLRLRREEHPGGCFESRVNIFQCIGRATTYSILLLTESIFAWTIWVRFLARWVPTVLSHGTNSHIPVMTPCSCPRWTMCPSSCCWRPRCRGSRPSGCAASACSSRRQPSRHREDTASLL